MLAALLAQRLGIVNVLSTDSLRHVLRCAFSGMHLLCGSGMMASIVAWAAHFNVQEPSAVQESSPRAT